MNVFRSPVSKLLLLLLCWGYSVSYVAAAPLNYLLKEVRLSSVNQYDRLTLVFQQPFAEEPILNFDPGLVYIRLMSTSADPSLSHSLQSKENSLVKLIRLRQGKDSVLITLVFHSAKALVEDYYSVQRDQNTLSFDFDRAASLKEASAISTPKAKLDQDLSQRLLEKEGLPATFAQQDDVFSQTLNEATTQAGNALPPQDWMMSTISLILALLLVLILIYIVAFVYNRFLAGRLPSLQGRVAINLVSSFYVGPKQKIIVVEINKRLFALGITLTSINFLTEIKDPKDQSFLENVEITEDQIRMSVDQTRANFWSTLEKVRKQSEKIRQSESSKDYPPPRTPKQKTSTAPSSLQENPEKSKLESPEAPPATTFKTPIQAPFPEQNKVEEQELLGDPKMLNFSRTLTSKLKSLKPIK
ncbi:flagellar biosynthetic protein FliO [Deltaproteobacteria bacterium TL4]